MLRSDLLRPGPLELVNSHAVPRVTASVIYGDTQPKVQEVESTALPAAVTTPTQSTPRGHRPAKTKSVETIDTLSGGNNAWLPDQSNGKAIGSFQPTGYIQSRATNSQPILPDHVFEYQEPGGVWRELQIVRVGQWHAKERAIVARTRILEITPKGLRPSVAWDDMKVVNACLPSKCALQHYTHGRAP